MSESNNGGKPGGWFPDFNYLLLALLAGTLFVSQVPFHQWRPGNPESSSAVVHEVNARPWQDPFEAVNKYAVKENYQGTSEPGRIQDEIAHKIAAAIDDDGSQLDRVNVVAVMLPGGVYYEDGENRRKLRYAVLSGFNAALQYMPENSSSIQYFQNKALRIIYEWLVYQPTHHNLPPLLWQDTEPQAGEKRYERPPVLVLWLNSDDFSITPHQKLKDLISGNLGKDKIGKIAVLGPYDSGILQDLVGEMSIAERNKRDDERYSYYSPSATIQESNLLNENSQASLQQFFFDHGLKFQRITSTDQHLAVAVKDELELRGIEPSKRNRILLIGEWDSLYTWHLTNTFAGELLKNRENDCPSQDWYNRQHDIAEQCVFRASYLRGLDGEKAGSNENNARSSSKNKSGGEAKSDIIENLEEASGDSQFDYVRRLAAEIAKVDAAIRQDPDWRYHDPHAIKAIGLLGSDVYDKLLITEALHSEFPDAVFFTNGLDARFIEPKNNAWARNMLMAASFSLALDRNFQADIPPFRDNTQTAFFLATEMALAKQFKNDALYAEKYLSFEENIRSLLRTSNQAEFDDRIMPDKLRPARIIEVGRTQSFDLNPEIKCESGKDCLHPNPERQEWNHIYLIAMILAACCALLWFKPSREFLGGKPGLRFVASMTIVCCVVLVGVRSHLFASQSEGFDGYLMFKLIGLALFYACLMIFIVSSDQRLTNDGETTFKIGKNTINFWKANMVLVAISLGIIWYFVRPQGLLGSIEPYALWDGVSMWTSQAIRFAAFILASCFIIEVSRFPGNFSRWMDQHFSSVGSENQTVKPSAASAHSYLRQQWEKWKNQESKRHIKCGFIGLFAMECLVLWTYGFPNVPYRGSDMFSLNIVLLQGLLLPAALILLVLVSDATMTAVKLVENCFLGEDDINAALLIQDNADGSASQQEQSEKHEWMEIRFIVEITRRIYEFIGYPLIIALLIVLACSSYFDNWIMPFHMKLGIGLCLGWLLYWDYRLKKAADQGRENALKSLRIRAIKYRGNDRTKNRSDQLERIIGIVENYDATVYKSFTQRPIFKSSLLIMIALLADSVDYYMLASKLVHL